MVFEKRSNLSHISTHLRSILFTKFKGGPTPIGSPSNKWWAWIEFLELSASSAGYVGCCRSEICVKEDGLYNFSLEYMYNLLKIYKIFVIDNNTKSLLYFLQSFIIIQDGHRWKRYCHAKNGQPISYGKTRDASTKEQQKSDWYGLLIYMYVSMCMV